MGGGRAAESYDAVKRSSKNTERRCENNGLRFWPIILEQKGGRYKAADVATGHVVLGAACLALSSLLLLAVKRCLFVSDVAEAAELLAKRSDGGAIDPGQAAAIAV